MVKLCDKPESEKSWKVPMDVQCAINEGLGIHISPNYDLKDLDSTVEANVGMRYLS